MAPVELRVGRHVRATCSTTSASSGLPPRLGRRRDLRPRETRRHDRSPPPARRGGGRRPRHGAGEGKPPPHCRGGRGRPRPGTRRDASWPTRPRQARGEVASACPQPAPFVRVVRPLVRTADAAQLLVQQHARVGASACEGLGTQTGANPAALLRDDELTLARAPCCCGRR